MENHIIENEVKRLFCNELYNLYCYADPYYVKGINPNISCKHNKTFMQGDDCCEYLITLKVNKD